MDRRALLIAAAGALVASPTLAAGKKAEEPAGPVGQYVDLLPIALPIVAYGEVVNYIFVYVRLDLAPSVDAMKMRAKEPYFRDALVRAGHRTPFNSAKDYVSLDEAKLKAAMSREAVAIAGKGAVKSVTVVSQSPKRRTGLPKPKGV
jgi:hypothetical protein